MQNHRIITGDCLIELPNIDSESVDVVVTSPPYNLDINYGKYDDNMPMEEYLKWTFRWMNEVKRVLKKDGSFFLNVGSSLKEPWTPLDVAQVARRLFRLQNRITWVKSIAIEERTHGHFKPINSKRFLNDTNEFIFHFTLTGDIPVNRLAVGVPFTDKTNVSRWSHGRDVRCRGNTWFIPYETIQHKTDKGDHPAIFPVNLPLMCVQLHGIHDKTVVLDPFGGTGTTTIACERLGVDSILVELDPQYVAISINRLQYERRNYAIRPREDCPITND